MTNAGLPGTQEAGQFAFIPLAASAYKQSA